MSRELVKRKPTKYTAESSDEEEVEEPEVEEPEVEEELEPETKELINKYSFFNGMANDDVTNLYKDGSLTDDMMKINNVKTGGKILNSYMILEDLTEGTPENRKFAEDSISELGIKKFDEPLKKKWENIKQKVDFALIKFITYKTKCELEDMKLLKDRQSTIPTTLTRDQYEKIGEIIDLIPDNLEDLHKQVVSRLLLPTRKPFIEKVKLYNEKSRKFNEMVGSDYKSQSDKEIEEDEKKTLDKLIRRVGGDIQDCIRNYKEWNQRYDKMIKDVDIKTEEVTRGAEVKRTTRELVKEEAKEKAIELSKAEKAKLAREKAKMAKAVAKVPVGGAGEAIAPDIEVELAKPPVKVPISVEQAFVIEVNNMARRVREGDSTLDELTDILKKIASMDLNPTYEAQIEISKDNIKRKVEGFLRADCFSPEEIAGRCKSKTVQAGIKFEQFLLDKEVTEIHETGYSPIYDVSKMRSNDTNIKLSSQIVTVDGETYGLNRATIYDISSPGLEVELKYYDKAESLDDIYIPIDKFTSNRHFIPYFASHKGEFKLYNIWCKDTNEWVNADYYKSVLFTIGYKNGVCYYDLTDDMTKGNLRLQEVKERSVKKGLKLYRLFDDGISYPMRQYTFNKKSKLSVNIPSSSLNECYIKKKL